MGAPRSLERPTEGTRAPPAPRTDLLDYRSHAVGGRLPEARVLGQDRASSYKAERGQAAKDDSSSRCSQGGAGGSRLRSPAGFSSANSWSRSQREHHTGPDARAAVCRAKGKEGFSPAESSLHVITTVSIMHAEHEACAHAHTHAHATGACMFGTNLTVAVLCFDDHGGMLYRAIS